MVNLYELEEAIARRKESFPGQRLQLIIKQDYETLAALYMEILSTSKGENWDFDEMYVGLDDVMEELRKKGATFFGQPISLRGTSSDDRYVLVRTTKNAPIIKERKDENGNLVFDENGRKIKDTVGYRDKQVKKHIHREVYELKNKPAVNIYGIPNVTISGECFKGGLTPYISSYANNVIRPNPSANAFRITSYVKNNGYDVIRDRSVEQEFFSEIQTRVRYGLAGLYRICINDNLGQADAGIIRLDYDVDDDLTPVCCNVAIYLTSNVLCKAHIRGRGLVSSIVRHINAKLQDAGFAPLDNSVVNIYTSTGDYKLLEEHLDKMVEKEEANIEAHRLRVELPKEAAAKAAAWEEKHEAELAAEELARKAALRQQAKERRAEEAAKRKAEKLVERQQKAEARHNKAVENVMTTLVTSVIQQGMQPCPELFVQMRDNITAEIQQTAGMDDDTKLVLEALDTLITRG